jgi:transposase
VWIATGHTDMRRGMQSLALTVQESLKRDPHGLHTTKTVGLPHARGHGELYDGVA